MIAFTNTFLSYLLIVIIFMAVIVLAVICGKKLREAKDAKEAAKSDAAADKETE